MSGIRRMTRHVRELFDDIARLDFGPAEWSIPFTSAALELAAPDDRTRVLLDVGCGDALAYRSIGASWRGVAIILGDISSGVLGHVDPRTGHRVQLAAEELPLASGSVDRIVCVCTLRFSSAPATAMAEFARILDPRDGRVVVAELTRQRDRRISSLQQVAAAEMPVPPPTEPIRRILPPLRGLADAAGLSVTLAQERFFVTELSDPDACWRWFSSTHRTALAPLTSHVRDSVRAKVEQFAAANTALGDGLRSEQGVAFTVLEHRGRDQ